MSRPANRAQHADVLARGVSALGLALLPEQNQRLMDYLDQLVRWNKAYNLTAIRERSEMIVMHLLDSLAVLPVLNRVAPSPGLHLVDVGTGAGLPGIPLKLARPDLRLTLVEINGKKAAFLRHAVTSIPLANAEVCQARVENLSPETLSQGPADLIICRAFRAMDDMLDLIAPLIGDDTVVLALKGPAASSELAALEQQTANPKVEAIRASHELTLESVQVPGLAAERAVVVMAPRGQSGTPERQLIRE